MRIQQINNVEIALKHAQKNGIKFQGIGAEDIVDGKRTLTLGLIWAIIQKVRWVVMHAGWG